MRAVILGESILSKCPGNVRNYSNKSHESLNDQKATPIEEQRLIQRVCHYFKAWTEQFEPYPAPNSNPPPAATSDMKLAAPQQIEVETKTKSKELFPKETVENHTTNSVALCPVAICGSAKESIDVIQCQSTMLAIKPRPQSRRDTLALKQVPMNLLSYPVVPLEETLERYLNSIRPFFTANAFLKQQDQTNDFLHNKGAELQKLLEEAGKREINWLAERWMTSKYLRHRGPLTVFSSPCLAFPKQDFRNAIDFVHFTAQVIYGMCEFKTLLDMERIPVNTMDSFDLDNSQYYKVFGTVRKPQRSCDIIEQCNSDYVVVIHKNNFYKVPVFNAEGHIMSIDQLRNHLLKIVQSSRTPGPEIGLLTHDTRNNWADAYITLCRQESNRTSVQCIEQSLFTVSLDESVPEHRKSEERSMLAAQLLHGGGFNANSANRWMDKTLQLIVNPNGMAGICFEHAPADPQPTSSIMDYVQTNIMNSTYGAESEYIEVFDQPHPLYFSELDESMELWLGAARRNINKISSKLCLEVFKFPCFGKCLIKSQGLSPDSFIQMALQLAFYRLHKELPAQYESAHLRVFKYGRTEAIRSASNESLAFVSAMISKTSSLKTRLLALRSAVDCHQEHTKLAMLGHAVDRHLFGLRQMAREHALSLPDFFCSQGFVRSSNFRVISAQVATPFDGFMAFGPHNSEGYGCCYNPHENEITFAISSWNIKPKISAKFYGKAIELALADMGQLMLEAGGASAAQDAQDCKK